MVLLLLEIDSANHLVSLVSLGMFKKGLLPDLDMARILFEAFTRSESVYYGIGASGSA